MWAFRIMQKDILGLHYSELQWSDSLFQVFFYHTCQIILCKVLLQLFLMTKETAKIECFANRACVSYVYQSYFDLLKCIHLFFILCNLILNRNNNIKHYKIH